MVVHRDYDLGERLVSTGYGNGLIETRGYLPGDNLLATISTPGIATASDPSPAPMTSFTYAYDQDRRKTAEIDAALPPGNDQRFAYDAEGRLVDWRRGAASFQTWTLTPVGDWRQTVRDGVVENRTHTPVHEIRAIDRLPVLSDAKGNLSLQLVPLQLYTWDSENRLVSAAGLTPGFGAYIARYRYDALGRRIQKTVNGQTTTWISSGAQEIVEITGDPRHVPWLDPHPDLSPAVPPGAGPQGSLLQLPGSLHVDFRPDATGAIPGWLIDTGDPVAWHTPTLRYGWDRSRAAVDRGYLDQPLWDSFVRMMAPLPTRGAWSIALANGSYPVVIVMGDAMSRNQTNTIAVNGQVITDPTPAQPGPDGYALGAFDGYTVQATVTSGTLTIAAAPGAKDPKLCFVEIGPRGGALNQAIRDRVTQVAQTMTDATATERGKAAVAQEKVYGPYVDEPLALIGADRARSYVHANHLYSVAALTNSSGVVQERYRYDAYGKRTVLAGDGAAVRTASNYGNQIGFTGRYHDDETGLVYFRNRMYGPSLGRFVGRDSWSQDSNRRTAGDGYQDGLDLYSVYFAPDGIDPDGTTEGTGTYIPFFTNLIGDPTSWCISACAPDYQMESMTKTGKTENALFKSDRPKRTETISMDRNTASHFGVGVGWLRFGVNYTQIVTVLADVFDMWDVTMEKWKCKCKCPCWSPYCWLAGTYYGWKEASSSNKREYFTNYRLKDAVTTGATPSVGGSYGGVSVK